MRLYQRHSNDTAQPVGDVYCTNEDCEAVLAEVLDLPTEEGPEEHEDEDLRSFEEYAYYFIGQGQPCHLLLLFV